MSIKNTKCNTRSIYQIKYVTCAKVLQDPKIKFGHTQISGPKIGILMLKTACINPCEFLLMEFQASQIYNEKIKTCRDFSKIETNNLINTHLEGIDQATDLCVNRNNADLLSELFLKKIKHLINFRASLQRVSNKKITLQNKPWITKGLLWSIETKIDLTEKWV